MKRNVSVVCLIVATQSSGPPASGKIIKEMLGSVASGTLSIIQKDKTPIPVSTALILMSGDFNNKI